MTERERQSPRWRRWETKRRSELLVWACCLCDQQMVRDMVLLTTAPQIANSRFFSPLTMGPKYYRDDGGAFNEVCASQKIKMRPNLIQIIFYSHLKSCYPSQGKMYTYINIIDLTYLLLSIYISLYQLYQYSKWKSQEKIKWSTSIRSGIWKEMKVIPVFRQCNFIIGELLATVNQYFYSLLNCMDETVKSATHLPTSVTHLEAVI